MSRSAWGLSTPVVDREWHLRAECGPQRRWRHELNADAWIVAKTAPKWINRQAARVCNTVCPVRVECGEWYDAQPAALRTNVIAAGVHWDADGYPRPVVVKVEPPPSEDDLLYLTAAAEIADLPELAVAGACLQGQLPYTKDRANRYQIRRGDLKAWLRSREVVWTS